MPLPAAGGGQREETGDVEVGFEVGGQRVEGGVDLGGVGEGPAGAPRAARQARRKPSAAKRPWT